MGSRFNSFNSFVVAFCSLVCLAASSASAQSISAGQYHTVVAKPDGTVWTFGENGWGQLGDGSFSQRTSPVQVTALSGITAVAAGQSHTLALKNDGTVWAWGANGSGQLGDGTNFGRTSPVAVTGLTGITAIAAGAYHSLALKNDGTVWAWGANTSGQLGDGTTTNWNTPAMISMAALSGVTAIAAGGSHTLARKSDGTLWACGSNQYGQIGDASTTTRWLPVQVLTDVSSIAAGSGHSLALKTDGTVWGWGDNGVGSVGDGTTTNRMAPVQAVGLTSITKVTAGLLHSIALRSDGSVWIWGWNNYSQLGDGTGLTRVTPIAVSGLTNVTMIAAGHYHSLAATTDGVVSAWGRNDYGQVGDGTTIHRSVPTAISDAAYTWPVATPTFTPTTGTYTTTQTITISTATPGATIYYTSNGVDPTQTDAAVPSGGTVTVDRNLTLKAKAWKTGLSASRVATATYTMQVSNPSFTPPGGTYTSAQSVSITSATTGATIRYTTDGSDPTESSPLNTTPINITTTTTLKARAWKPDWTPSWVIVTTYAMNTLVLDPPAVSPASGTYVGTVQVTMSTAQSGASIRYTIDGSEPTAASQLYTGPMDVLVSRTIKAKVFHPDAASPSATTSRTYTVQAAAPTFSVASGSYPPGTTVTITGPAGATIRYTTTGVDPTDSDTTIAAGSSITLGNFTLKAKAWKTGNDPSAVASAAYTVTGGASITNVPLAAGQSHTVVAKPDGTAWNFGDNSWAQLGDGSWSQRTSPVQVSGLTGVAAVAAGESHTLALKTDGTVWAWGYNAYGQLGDGTTSVRSTPVQVTTLTGVIAIAAGRHHSLALKNDGTVWAWGFNGNGQLGDGTLNAASTPVQVNGLTGVTAIAAGYAHSAALKSDGTIRAWGSNQYGQLGDGTTTDRTTSVQVLNGVSKIALGGFHSLVIKTDGSVWSWGYNGFGQLGDGTWTQRAAPVQASVLTGISQIAGGQYHSVAVRNDGTLWAWGSNSSGQLGDGTMNGRATPATVAGLSSISAVAAGHNHTIAVTTNGTVYTWGHNGNGQLGDGSTTGRLTPTAISEPAYTWRVATPTLSLASGTYIMTQALTVSVATPGATIHYTTNGVDPTETDPTIASGGSVAVDRSMIFKAKAWKTGSSPSGVASATYTLQVSSPGFSPGGGTYTSAQTVTLVPGTTGSTVRYTVDGSEPTETSTAYSAPFTISTTTTVKAKGFMTGWTPSATASAAYTINTPTVTPPTFSPSPGTFANSVQVTMTSASGTTIRYTTDGTEPTATSTIYSNAITLVATTTVKAKAFQTDGTSSATTSGTYTITGSIASVPLAAGQAHTAIAKPDGTVWTFGDNGWSQLGDGTSTQRTSPVQVSGLSGVAAVAAGEAHTLALKNDGTVWGWGTNNYGQLGDGTSTGRSTPMQTAGLTGITALVAGRNHALALKSDGTVWAWGFNGNGQLGNGTYNISYTPVQVSGLTAVSAIGAGYAYSAALKGDGTLWTWGSNQNGQLGDGTTTERLTPVQVLTNVSRFAAGGFHMIAVKTDATIWAWGFNMFGQVGDGTSTQRNSPVQITALSGVSKVAAGLYHSVAIKTDGTVWAWGSNSSGQLGDGTTVQRETPIAITGLANVSAVAAGHNHTVAVTSNGTIYAWGHNGNGQLGDGTTATRTTPAAMSDPDYTFRVVTPTLTPAPGVYTTAQNITIATATVGATIRYTLDGTDPTETSPVYSAPIAISATTTLKAWAYRSGWTPSPVLSGVYTIDTEGPTITVSLLPGANANGWHHTDVTISFACSDPSGVASCPGPVTLTQAGAGQVVTRTATDTRGQSRTISMTVNIDRTAPTASISSPANRVTTADASLSLTGSVSDALSGIGSAACNGAAATLSGGSVSCTVALSPGLNTVVLHTKDVAGNSASAAIQVTRTATSMSLVITPSTRTLIVGESRALKLADQTGVTLTGATWTSSHPAIASVSADGSGVITAVTAGEVTITAARQDLTATATVKVVTALASGTTRWSLAPLVGSSSSSIVYTHRVHDSGPDMFAVESDATETQTFVRALTPDGDQLWTQVAPAEPAFGDSFGGIVGTVRTYSPVNGTTALVRFAGPASAPPWRYDSPGKLQRWAQAPDGTIYATELIAKDPTNVRIDWAVAILALDGQTGQVKWRQVLPRDLYESLGSDSVCRRWEHTPLVSPPAVGVDGSVSLEVRAVSDIDGCSGATRGSDRTLKLLTLQPDGTQSWQTLFESHGIYTSIPWEVAPGEVLPAGVGGTLAVWSYFSQPRVSRINGATVSEFVLPSGSAIDLVGDAGTAFLRNGGTLSAIDVNTWSTKWTSTAAGTPTAALHEGGVVLHDPVTATLTVLDKNGLAAEMTQMALTAPSSSLHHGQWNGSGGSFSAAAVIGAFVSESPFSFRSVKGNVQLQAAPRLSYENIDRAAVAALKYFNPPSIERNREYGGSICRTAQNRFVASVPNVNEQFSDSVVPSQCSTAQTRVGDYHTHGFDGNDGFSGGDIQKADQQPGIAFYVGTPCGHIDKYLGPNYTVYARLTDKTMTSKRCTQ